MSQASTNPPSAAPIPPAASGWVDRIVRDYPHAPLVAPFMTFLLLMTLDHACPESWRTYTYAARSLGSLWVVWVFRHHLPPLGPLKLHIAIPMGLLVAVGWVEVHHFFAGCSPGDGPCGMLGLFGIEHRFDGFSWYRQYACFDCNPKQYFVPSDHYHSPASLWTFLIVRIGGASTAVPIVEELFWRAFMLRALIDWSRFEDVPLGKFGWWAFLGTSLLSAVQHQPQWEVGILCWLVYNGVFYWTRSLSCCMIMHGLTNLTLYIYVYNTGDWRFW